MSDDDLIRRGDVWDILNEEGWLGRSFERLASLPAVTQPAPDAAAIRKAAAKTLLDMLYKRNGAHEGMTREYAQKLWDAAKDRNGYAAVEAFLATLITEKPHDK